MGFFKNVANLSLTTSIYQQCPECGRNFSKDAIPLSGKGEDKVMVVFAEPDHSQTSASRLDPATQQPIQGDWIAGKASILTELNTYYRSQGRFLPDCIWATGVLRCPAISTKPYDAIPCLKKLDQTIKDTKPIVIFAVGKRVTGALFHLCFPDGFKPNQTPDLFFGHQIPVDRYNAYIIPIMSDIDIAGSPREANPVAMMYLRDHINSGLALKDSRPFKPGESATPDTSQIQYLSHPDIPRLLKEYSANYKYAAFDYETTTLHPEARNARVLTASVCFGNSEGNDLQTVVFPFTHTSTIDAWREFLAHPISKIGANIKFETRWSIVYFQQPVVHWHWDTCVLGHIFNCDTGAAGLKFLSTAFFGVSGYDKDVEDYINSKEEYGENRLTQVPLQDLMTYNAMDSILTFRIAKKQHQLLNREF